MTLAAPNAPPAMKATARWMPVLAWLRAYQPAWLSFGAPAAGTQLPKLLGFRGGAGGFWDAPASPVLAVAPTVARPLTHP